MSIKDSELLAKILSTVTDAKDAAQQNSAQLDLIKRDLDNDRSRNARELELIEQKLKEQAETLRHKADTGDLKDIKATLRRWTGWGMKGFISIVVALLTGFGSVLWYLFEKGL